jgi:hypothetical protein
MSRASSDTLSTLFRHQVTSVTIVATSHSCETQTFPQAIGSRTHGASSLAEFLLGQLVQMCDQSLPPLSRRRLSPSSDSLPREFVEDKRIYIAVRVSDCSASIRSPFKPSALLGPVDQTRLQWLALWLHCLFSSDSSLAIPPLPGKEVEAGHCIRPLSRSESSSRRCSPQTSCASTRLGSHQIAVVVDSNLGIVG